MAKNHDADLHLVFAIPDDQNGYVQAYIPAETKAQVEQDAKSDLDELGTSLDSRALSSIELRRWESF